MDPLTAISLAGNIIAFLDFAAKLLQKTNEIHSSASGVTEGDRTVKQVARDLQRLALNLKSSQESATKVNPESEALIDLCSECEDLAEDLLDILEELQAKDPSSKRQSVKAALRRLWKSRDIEDLQGRLDLLGKALDRRTQEVFRNEIKEKLSEVITFGRAQRIDITELRKRVDSVRVGVTTASFGSEASQQLKDLIRMSDEAVLKARQRVVLDGLRFNNMNERFNRVEIAYKTTFDWIFKPPWHHSPVSDGKRFASQSLYRWLLGDTSIIHVLGKPGSGKSTLMKFLYEHPQVRHELRAWAGETPLVLAAFFFWRSGSLLQRTLEGLIRSLLHSVLERLPSLIPTMFPVDWDRTDSVNLGNFVLHLEKSAVIEAFQRLIDSPDILGSHKFAFFIDGLDEFEPDGFRTTYGDLARLLKKWGLNEARSIKICISSREYPVFETEFAQFPQLRLQTLTWDDMRRVARGFLEGEQIAQLGLNSQELHQLEEQLVSKSDGVFLWLTLVIRNLEEGLINGDNFKDFSSRILSLPTELSDLFISLFESISQHDQSYCFPILRVLYETNRDYPLSLFAFWCLDMVHRGDDVTYLVEVMHCTGDSRKAVEKRLLVEMERLCRRIRGRFCGLLQAPPASCLSFGKRVDFNHRSIHEFLASDAAKQRLGPRFSNHDWYQNICHSFELQSKLLMHPRLGVVADCVAKSQTRRHRIIHRLIFWDRLITSLALFTGSRFNTIPRIFFDTIDNCDRILSRDPMTSNRWDPKACPNAAYYLCLQGADDDSVTLKCTCRNGFHFTKELCMARASIHEYFSPKVQSGGLASQATAPEFLLASLLEARHELWSNSDRCVTFFRTLLGCCVNPNPSLRLQICDPKDTSTLQSLFCLVVRATFLTYFEPDRRTLLSIIDCFVKVGIDTRLWFILTDNYKLSIGDERCEDESNCFELASDNPVYGIESDAPQTDLSHDDSLESPTIREYNRKEIHLNLGSSNEVSDEGCERTVWACQKVAYPPFEWLKTGEGGERKQLYTLFDIFEEEDLKALPEVENALRLSKDAILSEVSHYGFPKQISLQGLDLSRVLMVYVSV